LGRILSFFNLSVIFTWYATVIAATIVAFPLMYKTALGAFKQIDHTLIASARTLGSSEWVIFWKIILPLAKPGLIAGTLLAFARSLGEFGATLMLAGSIPGQTQTIPIAIFFAAEAGKMNEAWAWVSIILVISLGIITVVSLVSKEQKLQHKNNHKFNFIFHKIIRKFPQKYKNNNLLEKQLIVDIQKQLPGFFLNISFKTNGQPLGLLGASGAGKSFVLRCIAGLETPDQGRIILNGRTLFDSQAGINLPSRDRKIGYLFQNYALFPHLTVAQNIAFALPKDLSNLQIKQRVEKQLIAVDLAGLGHRYPDELSGGQQQRVALARVLASDPEVLLLDEPFSALDTYLRDRMEKLLRLTLSSYQGITLFITHNLEEVYRVCQNLLVIDEGQILDQGSKYDIFEHPNCFRVAQVTGCKNFSLALPLDNNQVKAVEWDCILDTVEPIHHQLTQVGIRAHQITFLSAKLPLLTTDNYQNIFPCWLAAISETQHRVTLYIKLNHPPNSASDYHLQAEVFKENWRLIKDDTFPWKVQLKPTQLILV
jgi:ABC-type sulfate/molybdate transport systems ATPase subunit